VVKRHRKVVLIMVEESQPHPVDGSYNPRDSQAGYEEASLARGKCSKLRFAQAMDKTGIGLIVSHSNARPY